MATATATPCSDCSIEKSKSSEAVQFVQETTITTATPTIFLPNNNRPIILGQTRCRDAHGFLATIHFDGLIPSRRKQHNDLKRYWGVVWDDVARGKHNGSLVDPGTGQRIQYFTPPPPPPKQPKPPTFIPIDDDDDNSTCASFVLPHKVDLGRPLSYSVFLERYQRRAAAMEEHRVSCYGHGSVSGGSSGGHDHDSVSSTTTTNHILLQERTKPIEFVGADKITAQQQLETLSTISLRSMGIHSIPEEVEASFFDCFDVNETETLHPHHLDKEDNNNNKNNNESIQTQRPTPITPIIPLLPPLSTLTSPPSIPQALLLPHCIHLDLTGNLLTDWHDLRRLLHAMPQLQQLSVAHNRFIDTTLTSSSSSSSLLLNNTSPPPLALEREPNQGGGVVWSRILTQLNLRQCHIQSARTLRALGQALPSLQSLCCAYAQLPDLEEKQEVCRTVLRRGIKEEDNNNNPKNIDMIEHRMHALTLSSSAGVAFALVTDLDMTACGLTTAQLPWISMLFPQVTHLNLTDNPIDAWPCPSSSSTTASTTTLHSHSMIFPHLTHLQWTLWRLPWTMTTPRDNNDDGDTDGRRMALPSSQPTTDGSAVSTLIQALQPLVLTYSNQLVSLRLNFPVSSSSWSRTTLSLLQLQLTAVLAQLQMQNGSRISPMERKDAEVYYLRQWLSTQQQQPPPPQQQAITTPTPMKMNPCSSQHPSSNDNTNNVAPRCAATHPRPVVLLAATPERIATLRAMYPSIVATALSSTLAKTSTLHDDSTTGGSKNTNTMEMMMMNVVTVEMRSLCAHSCEKPPVIRKLPVRLTIGRLKALLSKHFDLDVDLQELSWIRNNHSNGNENKNGSNHNSNGSLPIILHGEDDSTLEQCGLVQSGIVFMNERVISQNNDEKNKEKQLFWERVQQQEQEIASWEQLKLRASTGKQSAV